MPFTLKIGQKGTAKFATAAASDGTVTSRYITINTEAGLQFFKTVAILRTNMVHNSLGLYSFAKLGKDGKARFATLTAPKHLLSKRKSGCSWNPKGGHINMNTTEIEAFPVEYNGEQCPDAFYGSCLEQIFTEGNGVRDFFSTPEGRALFGELMAMTYQGLGNSFYDLLHDGQHPLIAAADANDWFTVDPAEWDDYVDLQEAIGGFMTMIDALKAQGRENFNVDLLTSDISADRSAYIGSASELFDRILKAQSAEMKSVSRNGAGLQSLKSIILVDPRVFAKYESDLITRWDNIPAMLQYYMNGKFCESMGCDNSQPIEGILRYKGHLIVSMPEWELFNAMTGTDTWRVLATTPGNFGVTYDSYLDQYNGLGLRMTQHLDAPYQGKVFMDTTFKVGAAIVDPNHIVNASITFTPK